MKKIALLPGGFKPPHAGHYNMAKWLAKNTDADVVVVKVGAKERDGITREMSLQLWNLYKESDPDPLSNKLLIQPSTSNSPVRDVYDFIEDTAPEGSTVYLGMGEKDTSDSRFKNIGKFAEPRNIQFQTVLVPPQAGGVSGTEMRGFIKNNQDTFFYNSLPDHMTDMDKEDAWAIVIPDPMNEDLYESGADTAWEDEEGNKVTLQDILDMTKNIPIKNFPTEKLAKIVLNWDNNPEEIERISQVTVSQQYPILIMVDESGKIQWILDGNHRAQKALRSKAKTIPAKLIKPSNLSPKAKKIFSLDEDLYENSVHNMSTKDFNQIGDILRDSNKSKQIHNLLLQMFPKQKDVLNYNYTNDSYAEFKRFIHGINKYQIIGPEITQPKNIKLEPEVETEREKKFQQYINGEIDKYFRDNNTDPRKVDISKFPPITIDEEGFVMDGNHRAFLAKKQNKPLKSYKIVASQNDHPNVEKILNIINPINEDLYDPNDHVSDYMKSSEYKAGMPDGPKKDITPSYKYKRGGLYGKMYNETVTDTDIICDNCGWTWAIVDGGDDLYICHTCGHDNTPNKMNEQKLFSKNWWKDIINEILLSEGGAAGHMAHPFDLPNVTSGRDLVNVFEQAANSLQTNPGAVKIDGVNSSIRLIDVGGTKQFAMDRGSKKDLDIKGITKADLEDRFSPGHGMIKVGGEVLDMFNEALPAIQGDLKKLGVLDDPSILFNMEYVAGKTNVQEYSSNFIAIHGLNKVKMEEVPGRMYRGKPLVKRYSQEFNYDKGALQSLLNNLAPIAKKRGFEVYGSVPTQMKAKPNFRAALSKRYTVETTEGAQTKPLGQWLEGMNNIPISEFIFMNVGGTKKKVGAVSKQVYLAILKGENVDELFEDQSDKQKAIDGFATYLGTEKLGDEILKVLDSPMGSVENHEGVVIRDEKIAKIPFKITGKFILGGLQTGFR